MRKGSDLDVGFDGCEVHNFLRVVATSLAVGAVFVGAMKSGHSSSLERGWVSANSSSHLDVGRC